MIKSDDNEVIKAQVKWIAEKVDRMDAKLDRLSERFNLNLGKMLGASAVIAAVASILIDLFCFHARAGYAPWGWMGWLPSVSDSSLLPGGSILQGSVVADYGNEELYMYVGSSWVEISGGGGSYTFADSLVNNSGTVTLVNDSASPGDSQYYGTNSGGTLGYYSLPAGTPGGSNTDVQFNNASSFGGSASLTWNGTALTSSQYIDSGLTASTPVYASGSKQLTSGTFSGNSTEFVTAGASTAAGCAEYDSSGNVTSSGTACTSGTVTAVSVASSNGFAGTSSGGATPALTLEATNAGIQYSNGTALSAATFPDSVTQSTGAVSLVGDASSPGDSYYYGTNASGTKGWYASAAANTCPAGSSGQVQYNSSSSCAGSSGMTYDGSGDLTLSGKINATTADFSDTTASQVLVTNASNLVTSASSLSTALGGLGGNFSSSTGACYMSSGSTTIGVLPVSAGGTDNGSLAVTAGGVFYSDGTKFQNVGAGTTGQVLTSNGSSAPSWANNGSVTAPAVTTITTSGCTPSSSCSGGDYIGPGGSMSGVLYLQVTVVGPGGGGAAGNAANSGSNGSAASTFGTSLLSAGAGDGGTTGAGQPGGSGGTGSLGGASGWIVGGTYGSGSGAASNYLAGEPGAGSCMGGGGPGAAGNAGAPSANAVAPGAGGGGGSSSSSSGSGNGASGGAGACVYALIPSPSSSYAYSVGDGGDGGSGTYSGGNGANGLIIVTAHYQ